jgi:hypothetical protein
MTLVPSLPPYMAKRVRQLDEVSYDLNNLYLNAQVIQWNPKNNLSAVGCRVEQIRPDIFFGEINIASENCPNLYLLKISRKQVSVNDDVKSKVLAQDIRDGRLVQVDEIKGEVQPSTNSAIYELNVKRTSEEP